MNRSLIILYLGLAPVLAFSQGTGSTEEIDQIIGKADQQYRGMIANLPEYSVYPRTTEKDSTLRLVGPGDWTSGFFPGSLWKLYEYTGDIYWQSQAEDRTAPIETQKSNTGTHDLGFMLGSSFGNGYRLMGYESYRDILVQAAGSLSTRFNPNVGCIRSWDFGSWEFPVIVDNMMNLELLFHATQFTGDSTYWDIAVSHADKTMVNHYRGDYSSFHVVDYNATTGDTLARYTHQGYSASSAWARGQSWGLYGFTLCYRFTGDPKYLAFAEQIALFLIGHENMPGDLIPYWDFDAPGIPDEPRDASAAAIMCSALLELSTYSSEYGETFRETATLQLDALASDSYSAGLHTNNQFILEHSTGSYPAGSEIDVPLNYADYYYLEALVRYRRMLNQAPEADFQWIQVDSTSALTVEFNASGSMDPEGDVLGFRWDFGDQTIEVAENELHSHTYGTAGEYPVTLYVSDSWGGMDSLKRMVTVRALVGTPSVSREGITVYPNPLSGGFTLKWPDWKKNTTAMLVNSTGQQFSIELSSGSVWVPTGHLESGIYVLVIWDGNTKFSKKLLILNLTSR